MKERNMIMSSNQYQRNVNSLDKEIADLEKKKSQSETEVATLLKNIAKAQKEMNQTKSESTKLSKIKQIESLNNKLAKKQAEVASYGKKVSEKTSKRNNAYQNLQRALSDEQKKQQKETEKLQKTYTQAIKSFNQRLTVSDIIENSNINNAVADEEYDVFISHAWEDKKTFVDDFVGKLENLGIRVWYDNNKLLWGDSMRSRIDAGLRKSKLGIVILSPDYIKEGKYWTKAELNGLFQLESINGKKILPIWHNLTKQQIMEFSPMIADKKAILTADTTTEDIANELKILLTKMTEQF